MRIDNGRSREIYELAKDPKNTFTNEAIGKKFGIDEATVRYHVKKWEVRLHEISRTNEKAASALANHAVDVHVEAMDILAAVKASILEAKGKGISPEKLAPLYSNWIRGLETLSELLGDLNRAPQVNVQVNQQFNELKAIVMGELCANCKQKVRGRLHELVGK